MARTGIMLAIETSNPSAGAGEVAIVEFAAGRIGAVRARARMQGPDSRHDDLASCIERARATADIRPRDLRAVAVSIGPGGFTSVRIAVTAAKAIAEVTGADLIGVPSAHVIGRGAVCPAPFGVALASKGESVHLTLFDAPDKPRGSGLLVTAADDLAELRGLVADGFLPDSLREKLHGIAIVEPVFDALACAECAIGIEPVDPAFLAPLYPREPEAVTKWRALHGG